MVNDFLHKFGPCGLLCEKCFAFLGGPIKEHAVKLKQNLGEFDNYAKRFETLLNEPGFGNYPAFKTFLNHLASSGCKGCREQECHLFTGCNVRNCYKEKGVDYCWQCAEFPCKNSGFDENLYTRWLKINETIKEIGLEKYYNSIKEKPRY